MEVQERCAQAALLFMKQLDENNITVSKVAELVHIPAPVFSNCKIEDPERRSRIISDNMWRRLIPLTNGKIRIEDGKLKVLLDDGMQIHNLGELARDYKVPGAVKDFLKGSKVIPDTDPELRKEQRDAGLIADEPPGIPEQKSLIEKGTHLVSDGNPLKDYKPMEVQDLVNVAVSEAVGPLEAKIDNLVDIIKKLKIVTTQTRTFTFELEEQLDRRG